MLVDGSSVYVEGWNIFLKGPISNLDDYNSLGDLRSKDDLFEDVNMTLQNMASGTGGACSATRFFYMKRFVWLFGNEGTSMTTL